MHVFAIQQPPLLQVLSAQQGVPGIPQVAQTPGLDEDDDAVQIAPAAQRSAALVPAQQVSPGWPQGVQLPLRHASPEPQVVPQQGWPDDPQLEQRPPMHAPPPAQL